MKDNIFNEQLLKYLPELVLKKGVNVSNKQTVDVHELMARYTVEELCEAAEKYFNRLMNWDYLLSKPFAEATEASAILLNFSYLINGSKPLTMSVVGRGGGGPTPTANKRGW